jgi:hypothetical protein
MEKEWRDWRLDKIDERRIPYVPLNKHYDITEF